MNSIRICMLMVASLVANYISAQGLPVLEISFEGKSLNDTYRTGKMKLTDTDLSVVEMNAKFKTRGATAKEYTMKPSFNMKLRDENGAEKDSTLLGMRSMSSWILDAMAIDRICMRNRVCFDIWNEYSRLPYETNFGSRNGTIGKFVEVYFNGTYMGIYCMTDRINRKLLDLKKPEIDEVSGEATVRGVLYKHGTNSIGAQNEYCFSEDSVAHVIGYHDAWELVEPEDYAGMQAWAPLENAYACSKSFDWVKENFYLEQLAEYQMFIAALNIEDNWGNKNSMVSARNVTADGNKKRFVYTPWDLDCSLGGSYKGAHYDGNYVTGWTMESVLKASTMPIPFATCNSQKEYKQLLLDAWLRGRKGALSVASVKNKLYKYRDQLVNSGAWQRSCDHWAKQKYKPCYVEDLAKEIDLIIEWYENRFQSIDKYFNVTEEMSVEGTTAEENANAPTFNLQGIKVQEPKQGIYIKNGKKFYQQ